MWRVAWLGLCACQFHRGADPSGIDAPAHDALATTDAPPSVAFVQVGEENDVGQLDMVRVAMPQDQIAGDLLVIVVGWNIDTGTVSSVTDSAGDPIQLAVAKQSSSNLVSQALYYAYDIHAGANMVTVTYATMVKDPDIRVVEYSGIATAAPLDGTASAQASTLVTNSGPLATSYPYDLVVGANTVHGTTVSADAPYTSRIITSFGDIVEDAVAPSPGSYEATATTSFADYWVMQAAAFRAR